MYVRMLHRIIRNNGVRNDFCLYLMLSLPKKEFCDYGYYTRDVRAHLVNSCIYLNKGPKNIIIIIQHVSLQFVFMHVMCAYTRPHSYIVAVCMRTDSYK